MSNAISEIIVTGKASFEGNDDHELKIALFDLKHAALGDISIIGASRDPDTGPFKVEFHIDEDNRISLIFHNAAGEVFRHKFTTKGFYDAMLGYRDKIKDLHKKFVETKGGSTSGAGAILDRANDARTGAHTAGTLQFVDELGDAVSMERRVSRKLFFVATALYTANL